MKALGKKFEVEEECRKCEERGDYCDAHLIAYCNHQNTALSEAADELETLTNHELSEFVQDENPITSIKRITRAIRKSAGVK